MAALGVSLLFTAGVTLGGVRPAQLVTAGLRLPRSQIIAGFAVQQTTPQTPYFSFNMYPKRADKYTYDDLIIA